MTKKATSIGIIGVGMVGGAVSDYYKRKPEFTVLEYDKKKDLGTLDAAVGADYVFLCLPSPTRETGEQDLSAYDEIVPKLTSGSKVIVKSTVLPGTTEQYQKVRPNVFFLHNPEFLDARTAVADFAHPDLQVLGYTEKSKHLADEVMKILPTAPHQSICASRESEMVKYFLNTFLATKNTFANQMYDYCSANGIHYDAVKDIVKQAPRIGGEVHLNIFKDGYRGFQGACLPKDLSALVHHAKSREMPLALLAIIHTLNQKYIKDVKEDG